MSGAELGPGAEGPGRVSPGRMWGCWVAANALGELVGLGLTGAIAAATRPWLNSLADAGVVASLLLAVTSGALVEGVAVGEAQWRVMRGAVREITRRAWIGATAVGAAVAWTLGMLPSTLMDMGRETAAPAQEPGAAAIVLLEIAMGLAGGSILAAPQWLVLRRHLSGAGWWVPLNAAAWAAGMPIAFLAVEAVVDWGGGLGGFLTAGGYLLATGAVVGAIHGLGLVWLTRR